MKTRSDSQNTKTPISHGRNRLYKTPQTERNMIDLGKSPSNSIQNAKSLTKSADRYIPSRTTLNSNFVRAIFNRKIKSAKKQKTKSDNFDISKSEAGNPLLNLSKENLDKNFEDTFLDKSAAEICRNVETSNEDLGNNESTDWADSSVNNNSTLELSKGNVHNCLNDDSFNANRGLTGRKKQIGASYSPCSASSKSASKRVRNELNSETFLGMQNISQKWNQRILKFNEAMDAATNSENKIVVRKVLNHTPTRSLKKRKKLEERLLKVQKSAEKVLDAPSIIKKPELNLMHWTLAKIGKTHFTKTDVLAVGLAEEVYFWFVEQNKIESLSALRSDNKNNENNVISRADLNVSCVLWFGSAFLAGFPKNSIRDFFNNFIKI
ncbi:hypothetical protein MHBO_001476 [Bonamia ostreae]|uniref:Uncharacterized protein n=1 Tax=Bonamia ostreae TaxID=126728 RepID=A0ABV2AJ44_9EUKA